MRQSYAWTAKTDKVNEMEKGHENESIETKLVWKTYDTEGSLVKVLVEETIVRKRGSDKILYISERVPTYVDRVAAIIITPATSIKIRREAQAVQIYEKPSAY